MKNKLLKPIDNKNNCSLSESWNDCCCVCVHQVEISATLTDTMPEVTGSVQPIIGYGCKVFYAYENSSIIFMDRKHGMCEEFYRKIETTPFYRVFVDNQNYFK